MDGVDRCLHAFGNLLHVDIGSGCRSGVPKHTLHILHCALLLSERRNRSPDDLKRQLRQSQVFRQFVQHSLPVVVRVQKSPGLIREDEGFRRRIGSLLSPRGKLLRQVFRQMHSGEASLRFAPGTNLAFVDCLRDAHGASSFVEALPPEPKQLAGTECIRHVQFEQQAIPVIQFGQCLPQLIPR